MIHSQEKNTKKEKATLRPQVSRLQVPKQPCNPEGYERQLVITDKNSVGKTMW